MELNYLLNNVEDIVVLGFKAFNFKFIHVFLLKKTTIENNQF